MASLKGTLPQFKKRRLRGACDLCHKKKIRCDSAKMPDNVCSNCVAFGTKCTHVVASKGKRKTAITDRADGHPFAFAFSVDTFGQDASHKLFENHAETRAKVAAILSPSETYSVPEGKVAMRQTLVELARYIQIIEHELLISCSAESQNQDVDPSDAPSPSSSASPNPDETEDDLLVDHMKLLNVSNSTSRFFGKSSNKLMIRAVMDLRKEENGGVPVEVDYGHRIRKAGLEHWHGHTLKWFPESDIPLQFPEAGLMHDLFQLYFDRFHIFFPILHKIHFMKLVNDGFHFHNREFGALVLAVCALASQFYADPHAYSSGPIPNDGMGWQWFSQVQTTVGSFVTVPNLYAVQLLCISILYLDLQGWSTPGTCWMLLGAAVRLIQEVGAHRKLADETNRTVETELWRRAFWAVVAIDAYMSAFLGRPRAINMDDCDQDLPVECDDEYWITSDPEMAFQQPAGLPCNTMHWNIHLKLLNILGFAQRTIYSVKKPDPLLGNKPLTEAEAVLQIDSALNAWLDKVPDYLRWDPHRKDELFFHQSALLYSSYYYVQIMVHKPFIPSSKSAGRRADGYPAIAICTTAARSCAHVLDIQSRRGILAFPTVHMSLLSAAFVLTINYLIRRRPPGANVEQEYNDLQKTMNILRLYESSWRTAGNLSVVLDQLVQNDLQKDPQTHLSPQGVAPSEQLSERNEMLDMHLPSVPADAPVQPAEGFIQEPWQQPQHGVPQLFGFNSPYASFDSATVDPATGMLQDLYSLSTEMQEEFIVAADDAKSWSTGKFDDLWSTVPTGYCLDDWANYLSNVGDMQTGNA